MWVKKKIFNSRLAKTTLIGISSYCKTPYLHFVLQDFYKNCIKELREK